MQKVSATVAPPTLVRLERELFAQPAIDLAGNLLGAVMVRRVGPIVRRARIAEVEAYLGPRDLAAHASKGRTARTEVLFGPPGHAYVYFIYGMHWMFNVVAGRAGDAEAVLIRAAEPLDDWPADLTGPGRLTRGFAITGADNRVDLTDGDIQLYADFTYSARIKRSKRIGVGYARHWKDRLLRFVDARSPIARYLPKGS